MNNPRFPAGGMPKSKIFGGALLRNFLILILAVGAVAATRSLLPVKADRMGASDSIYIRVLDGVYTSNDPDERRAMATPDNVDRLVAVYHARINKFFNAKILLIVKERDVAKIVELVTPPAEISVPSGITKREPCTAKNASTYCLSQIALKEYFDFYDAMWKAREIEKVRAVEKRRSSSNEGGLHSPLAGAIGDLAAGQKSINAYAQTLKKIDAELGIARQSLDRALATYNELQFALPLHRKYKEVFAKLVQYRNKISEVRQKVELYPDTFLNVTTTACT